MNVMLGVNRKSITHCYNLMQCLSIKIIVFFNIADALNTLNEGLKIKKR